MRVEYDAANERAKEQKQAGWDAQKRRREREGFHRKKDREHEREDLHRLAMRLNRERAQENSRGLTFEALNASKSTGTAFHAPYHVGKISVTCRQYHTDLNGKQGERNPGYINTDSARTLLLKVYQEEEGVQDPIRKVLREEGKYDDDSDDDIDHVAEVIKKIKKRVALVVLAVVLPALEWEYAAANPRPRTGQILLKQVAWEELKAKYLTLDDDE
jgi:hypothetical protein